MISINKRIFPSFIILLFLYLAPAGYCGTIQTTVTSTAAVLPSGQIDIKYVIKNTGDDTAQHIAVATFLALEAQRSDDLGGNPPGGLIRYDCTLTPADLKPGNYILVTRIDFVEQNGIPHRVYHFSPLPYRIDQVKELPPSLSVELSEPRFNVKSFWQSGNKCKLSLKNNQGSDIRPVVTLYLPDGFTTSEPERFYQLAAGESKEENFQLAMDSSVKETRPFYAVAWYEINGIHYSQLIEKKITVEDRPVLFKVFLIIVCMAVVIVLIGFFYRQRRKK